MKKYSIFIGVNSDGEHICEWAGSHEDLDEVIKRKNALDKQYNIKTLIWETWE